MDALGVGNGDRVEIVSDYARLTAVAEADDRLRRGVGSMSHCHGGLPGEVDDPDGGACTNRLIDSRRRHQDINAMPTMSGLPVRVVPAE
jgi:anaerobic selenocysteine-containing dehydrogenase